MGSDDHELETSILAMRSGEETDGRWFRLGVETIESTNHENSTL